MVVPILLRIAGMYLATPLEAVVIIEELRHQHQHVIRIEITSIRLAGTIGAVLADDTNSQKMSTAYALKEEASRQNRR
jgi:hypothetical protein